MSYTVRIAAKPSQFLERLRDEAPYQRMKQAIRALEVNPRPFGSTKLAGRDSLYRIRVGDYRIVYQIQDAVLLVLVVRIAHRREVYR